jgi:dipeptidyl-peptidase-4
MRAKAILVLIAGVFAFACAITGLASTNKPSLTLESIFSSPDFRSNNLDNVQWSDDGQSFTFTRPNPDNGRLDILQHVLSSGETRMLLSADTLSFEGTPIAMSGYRWSKDRRFLLVTGPVTRTWDSVFEAPHYIHDTARNLTIPLVGEGTALRNVNFSPSGQHVAYVLENNLYLMELANGETRPITVDGSTNIFNGIFDYGSTEFGFVDAWHWSPDGSRIAFWRLDVSDVKVWWMIDELGKYPEVRALKYPNTAEKHALNQIGVFDLSTGKTVWMDIGENTDDYIPRIDWTRSSDALSIQRLTRDHERLDVLLADAASGQSRVVLTETDPAWIDITEDLIFFQGTDHFVWTSEKSGYRHAYLYDYAGNEKQLTSGDWEISKLIAVDEAGEWLYFYAKKDSLIDQHVYRVALDGGEVQKLSGDPGWYEWKLSPDRSQVIETYSNAASPPRIVLRQPAGGVTRTLVTNDLPGLKKYAVPSPEFFRYTTSDGVLLDAYLIKPTNFDPTKKYPVIAYGYGNAGSQMVVNEWGSARGEQRDLWHRYMAEQGFIIFTTDNRTTTGRGKAAYNLTYGEYAKWAVHDQIEGAKYLRTLPFVDPERIGFWGWSGGGYLAAAVMTKGAPHYQVAVSVAPVIDLVNYQAVGVERWMDQLEDNPEGYYQVNLMNFAAQLEGDLLLIHGTGDENVKFAFTLQFADALIKANKQFDMMVYPNEHHGIENHRLHVYTKIADYFIEKL